MKISYFNSLLLKYEKNSFLWFSFIHFLLFTLTRLNSPINLFHSFKSDQLIHFQVAAANDAMPSLLQGRF
jgi:hypothetical protein